MKSSVIHIIVDGVGILAICVLLYVVTLKHTTSDTTSKVPTTDSVQVAINNSLLLVNTKIDELKDLSTVESNRRLSTDAYIKSQFNELAELKNDSEKQRIYLERQQAVEDSIASAYINSRAYTSSPWEK